MTQKIVHILNGDALKSQVEDWLASEFIVARECLIDGDEYGDDLDSFYQCRAKFISQYEGYEEEDYFEKTVPEIEKIRSLPQHTEVNLWFEDDVFCQVNFWFCVHLLNQNGVHNLWLVRPEEQTRYGFGGLNIDQLSLLLNERIKLQCLPEIADLWLYFKAKDFDAMTGIAHKLKLDYPFISDAIHAWIDSVSSETDLGKPTEILIEIMKDIDTQEFDPIFREFCKRAPIYGYGDLQIKRLLDQVSN